MSVSSEPETVVQRQLDAYNSRDIDALMSIYAEDAQLLEHPAKLLATGTAQLRTRFAERFAEPNLHAQLQKRLVMGPIVVDHEVVRRTFPEGVGQLEVIMIYEVQAGRIAKAWSIVGARTMDTSRG